MVDSIKQASVICVLCMCRRVSKGGGGVQGGRVGGWMMCMCRCVQACSMWSARSGGVVSLTVKTRWRRSKRWVLDALSFAHECVCACVSLHVCMCVCRCLWRAHAGVYVRARASAVMLRCRRASGRSGRARAIILPLPNKNHDPLYLTSICLHCGRCAVAGRAVGVDELVPFSLQVSI